MPNNDEKKVLLKVTDLKQWFPLKIGRAHV